MWDMPDNATSIALIEAFVQADKPIAAVCHAPVALTNVRGKDGEYLVKGKHVTGFTNEEEEAVGLEKAVPFLLQTKLQERGVRFSEGPKFVNHVVKSGRLVTGQNPASAGSVGKAMVDVLNFIAEGRSVPEENWCGWRDLNPHGRESKRF